MSRLEDAYARIDAANAEDPTLIEVDGAPGRPSSSTASA